MDVWVKIDNSVSAVPYSVTWSDDPPERTSSEPENLTDQPLPIMNPYTKSTTSVNVTDKNGVAISTSTQSEIVVDEESIGSYNPTGTEHHTDYIINAKVDKFEISNSDPGDAAEEYYTVPDGIYTVSSTGVISSPPESQPISNPGYSYRDYYWIDLGPVNLTITGSAPIGDSSFSVGGLPAKGSIDFTDTDISAAVSAAIDRTTSPPIVMATDADGNAVALTAAQGATLAGAFHIDSISESPTTGVGTIDWTYDPGSADLSFLASKTAIVTSTVDVTDSDGNKDTAQVAVTVTGPTELFTSGDDIVDFDHVTPAQIAAIDDGAKLYDSLGGDDDIDLPTQGSGSTIPQTSTIWSPPISGFTAGDGNDSLTGADANYAVTVGDGNDLIEFGNGSDLVTAGNGNDMIALGDGNNTVVAGTGSDSITLGSGIGRVSVGAGNASDGNSTVKVSGSAIIELGHGNDTVVGGAGAMLVTGVGVVSQEHTYGKDSIDEDDNLNNSVKLPDASASYTFLPSVSPNGSWNLKIVNSKSDADYDDISNFKSFFDSTGKEFTDKYLDELGPIAYALVAINDAVSQNTRLVGVSKWFAYVPQFFQFASSVATQPDALSMTKKATLNAIDAIVDPYIDQAQSKLQDIIPDINGTHAVIAQGAADLKTYIDAGVLKGIDGLTATSFKAQDAVWDADITGIITNVLDSADQYFNTLKAKFDFSNLPAGQPNIASPPPTISPLSSDTEPSGTVVASYLTGATVFSDANGNGVLDPGEPSTQTDGSGRFTLPASSADLVAMGGVDAATGIPNGSTLAAPPGSSVITPLTTLIVDLVSTGKRDVASASREVLAALSIAGSADVLNDDPESLAISGSSVGKSEYLAESLVDVTATLLSAAGASNSLAAIASLIGSSSAPIDLSDESVLAALAAAAGLSGPSVGIVSEVIAAANTLMISNVATAGDGGSTFAAISASDSVADGETARALRDTLQNGTDLSSIVPAYTGSNLSTLVSSAASQLALIESSTVGASGADGTGSQGPSGTGSAIVSPVSSVPSVPAPIPVIVGTRPLSTTAGAPVSPFAGVSLTDGNTDATETLTITLCGGGGTLAGAGLTENGDGSYILTGSAAAVTQALDALSFAPIPPAAGTAATTVFLRTDASSAGTTASDSMTSVTDAATPPAIGSPPSQASDAVTVDGNPAYVGHGTFLLNGTASSPAGVRSIEISAQVDGVTTDLGAATVNADGTFDFSDLIGRHTQGFITATETDGADGMAAATATYSLTGGLAGGGAEQDSYNADDSALLFSTHFNGSGRGNIDIQVPNQTVDLQPYEIVMNHRQGGTSFVYTPDTEMGMVDVIRGFKIGGADHDTIDLPSSDFRNFAAVLRNTGDVSGNAIITDPKTGDAIRLAGVTTAELKAHPKDFAFV